MIYVYYIYMYIWLHINVADQMVHGRWSWELGSPALPSKMQQLMASE